jgi:hypothetical protein
MNRSSIARKFWDYLGRSKRLVAGLVLFFSLVYITFSGMGWLKFQLKMVLAAVILVLWLIFEGVAELTANSTDRRHSSPSALAWTDALTDVVTQLKTATTSVLILGSSSESMFLHLREALRERSDLSIQVLLRSAEPNDSLRIAKQEQYKAYWLSLADAGRRRAVNVRFAPNQFLRAIIIDRRVGYLGFYVWEGGRLWGHNVPVIKYETRTSLGEYYIGVYLNRFQQLWLDGLEKPTP